MNKKMLLLATLCGGLSLVTFHRNNGFEVEKSYEERVLECREKRQESLKKKLKLLADKQRSREEKIRYDLNPKKYLLDPKITSTIIGFVCGISGGILDNTFFSSSMDFFGPILPVVFVGVGARWFATRGLRDKYVEMGLGAVQTGIVSLEGKTDPEIFNARSKAKTELNNAQGLAWYAEQVGYFGTQAVLFYLFDQKELFKKKPNQRDNSMQQQMMQQQMMMQQGGGNNEHRPNDEPD